MPKIKYRYNPETLSYVKVTVSPKKRLIKLGIMFAASIVISVVYYVVYSQLYDTPKERILNNELEHIRFKYQMLSQTLDHIDQTLSDIQKRDDNIYRIVLESDPIPASIRQAGFGGINRYEPLEGYINSNMMIAASKQVDQISKQLYVQTKSYDELIVKAINKEQMTLNRPAIQPISNKDLRLRSSGYGWRIHPIAGVPRFHEGIDFSADTGTDIYATGNGTVVKAGFTTGGYGNLVVIDHGFGYQTLYAHMKNIGVLPGSEVKRGDVIGTVGNTGYSKGPHLHYEVHVNGRHVDPINYFYDDLSPDDYVKLREQSQGNEILEIW